jgi:hypothetical protein
MPKKVNTGIDNSIAGDETENVVMVEHSQRPQRTTATTRRPLEIISGTYTSGHKTSRERNEWHNHTLNPAVPRHEIQGHRDGDAPSRPEYTRVRYPRYPRAIEESTPINQPQSNT